MGTSQAAGPCRGRIALHKCRRLAVRIREKTKGGIVIPETAKGNSQQHKMVAAGLAARDESGKWSGTEVKIDGQDLLIMKESDIMGVVGE